jgi:hypothetical protein
MYVIYSVSLRDQGIYLKILKLIFISYAVTNSKISIFASVRLRDRSAGILFYHLCGVSVIPYKHFMATILLHRIALLHFIATRLKYSKPLLSLSLKFLLNFAVILFSIALETLP